MVRSRKHGERFGLPDAAALAEQHRHPEVEGCRHGVERRDERARRAGDGGGRQPLVADLRRQGDYRVGARAGFFVSPYFQTQTKWSTCSCSILFWGGVWAHLSDFSWKVQFAT